MSDSNSRTMPVVVLAIVGMILIFAVASIGLLGWSGFRSSSVDNAEAPGVPVEVSTTEPAGQTAPETATEPATTTADETSTGGLPESTELEIVVVNDYAHDDTYTQGLEFIDSGDMAGLLLESGGQWGESLLRVWDPETGQVLQTHNLDDSLFAEGATIVGDQAWQLTWRAGTAFRYDLDSLSPVGEVAYEGEGWGLCQLGSELIMSDGSSTLTFRDPVSFEPLTTVEVTRGGEPVEDLNELECVDGDDSNLVWANVYQSTELLAIDPTSGNVVHTVDAQALVPDDLVGNIDLVLNGIAYAPDTGRFWLTGKRWPVLYEVELR